jgi:glucose-6-phosphate isomerase
MHKGGPPIGAFLQITADSAAQLAIPEAPYTFASLIRAQAVGDARSLAGRGLPFLRLHFPEGGGTDTLREWLRRLSAGESA